MKTKYKLLKDTFTFGEKGTVVEIKNAEIVDFMLKEGMIELNK